MVYRIPASKPQFTCSGQPQFTVSKLIFTPTPIGASSREMTTISDRLTTVKEHFGLNNVQLAKHAGVTKQAVGKWINQNVTPDAAAAVMLQQSLGVNELWLILGKGRMLSESRADGFSAEMIEVMSQLDDDQKSALRAVAQSMLKRET
jgi:transcriptional regulator with XRE-family HTH domain